MLANRFALGFKQTQSLSRGRVRESVPIREQDGIWETLLIPRRRQSRVRHVRRFDPRVMGGRAYVTDHTLWREILALNRVS